MISYSTSDNHFFDTVGESMNHILVLGKGRNDATRYAGNRPVQNHNKIQIANRILNFYFYVESLTASMMAYSMLCIAKYFNLLPCLLKSNPIIYARVKDCSSSRSLPWTLPWFLQREPTTYACLAFIYHSLLWQQPWYHGRVLLLGAGIIAGFRSRRTHVIWFATKYLDLKYTKAMENEKENHAIPRVIFPERIR